MTKTSTDPSNLGAVDGRDTAHAGDVVDLAVVLGILRRQWFVILLCFAAFVGAAFAYATLTPKTWRATARLLLDPRDKQLVGNDVNRPQQGMEPAWVETRQELVKAYSTLVKVVQTENLTTDPEIVDTRPGKSDDPVADAVRNLAEMVIVERPKENSLIDVSVTTRSPEKSARLANAIAAAYVDSLVEAKVDQVGHANDLLGRQIDDMRAKMLDAEAKVEDYKRTNGITMTRGNLVDEETVRQSNEMLVTARTKTQEARERSERLAQVLKSGDPTVHSQIDALGSAVLSRLKIEAAMAARRKNELEQSLGPRHPRVAAATSEVERARAQVADEVKSLAATAELDYQIARANEDNARKAVERAQARLSDTNQAVVGLQELQNEANARRELYKSFVSRMEETTLQRNTQVSDARIVSPAQLPLRPFAPRKSLALMLGAVGGLGCGLSLALWRGRPRPAARPAATAAATPEPVTSPTAAEVPAPIAASSTVPTAAAAIVPPPRRSLLARILRRRPAAAPAPVVVAPASAVVAPASAVVAPASAVVAPAAATVATATATVAAAAPVIAAPVVASRVIAPTAEVATPLVPTTTEVAAAPAPVAAVAPPSPEPSSPPPATTEAPSTAAAEPESRPAPPRHVDFRLSLDRIARLGGDDGPGTGPTAALVATADGMPDAEGLGRLAALSQALAPGGDRKAVRVIFTNTVPTVLTAALAHGLAHVAPADGGAALIDLAQDGTTLDAAFAAADLLDDAASPGVWDDWERVRDASGLLMLRPIDPIRAGDPSGHPGELAAVVDALETEAETIVVHLGREPTAALLFDVAAVVDQMVLVVDAQDVVDGRVSEEVDVMRYLLPPFDGLIVLGRDEPVATAAEPSEGASPSEPRRRRRATA